MRIIISLLILAILVVGCGDSKPAKDEMLLTGTIAGLKKGNLILQKLEDTTLVSIDSIVIDGDANFEIRTEVISPEIHYLYLRLNNGTLLDERLPFFAEAGNVNIKTSLKSFGNNAVISGSANQDKLNEYKKLVERFNNRNLDLIRDMVEAGQEGNDSLLLKLENDQRKLLVGKYLATVNYAVNNSDKEIAPYLMLSEVYDANVKYLDTVYNSLQPEIKESKYGSELEKLIKSRKKN